MFEAVISLCLATANGACRDQLLPGYEAPDKAVCAAAVTARPPKLDLPPGTVARDAPRCEAVGEILEFVQVAPGVFVHGGLIEEPDMANRGDVSNMGFVIGGASVAVIDSGAARWMAEAAWRAVRARTDLPVSHVILTHMHPDHVLGATLFEEAGAVVVGHDALPRALADRSENYLESLDRLIGGDSFLGSAAPEVTDTIADTSRIDLGDRLLELRAWPSAHTGTDLTVFDGQTGTLFAGDLVFDQHTPALDGSLLGWRQVLGGLAELGAVRIIPGHGAMSLPWPDGADPLRRYLGVLEADTRAAIEAGERLGEAVTHIAESERENWDLFDAYNPRNATVAFTELEWE